MPDTESRYSVHLYVLIFILCIIKFDLFNAKQLQDPAEFILIRVRAPSTAAADYNEMILGGLAAA